MMRIPDRIRAAADETGLYEYGAISTKDLEYSREVRKICEGNSCRQYGASWACPPAVGTLAECRKRVERYDTLLLFSQKYELADSFDFEGMGAALEDFKKLADRFHRRIWAELGDFLLLSNEGCGRCAKCTYPEEPCRFPELLHPSLEGYGFVVSALAEAAHVRYNNGPNTVTFFGALLWNGEA